MAGRRAPIPATGGHVFCCYGYEALSAVEPIVEHYLAPEAKVLCLWFGAGAVPPMSPRIEVISMPFGGLRDYIRSVRLFRRLSRTHPAFIAKPNVAYICHPFHFSGSHFFHAPDRPTLCLLPDGMINLVPRALSRDERMKALPKWLVTNLAGLRYHRFGGGHLTRYETGRYAATFTCAPETLRPRGGVVIALPRPTPATETGDAAVGATHAAMILDQELGELFSPDEEQRLRDGMATLVNTAGFGKVYYKAHPKGVDRFEQWAASIPGLERVTKLEAAEVAATRLGVTQVLSFYSTALTTMAASFGIAATAVLPANARRRESADVVNGAADVFRRAGIDVHRVH